MSKDSFKSFVRNNPSLARYVNNNDTSWQKLYETYELYGENNDVWSDYINDNSNRSAPKVTKTNELAFKELINMVKNIDLEKVRSGITGVQKAISLVQDLGLGGNNNNNSNNNEYQSRPVYQHFDD